MDLLERMAAYVRVVEAGSLAAAARQGVDVAIRVGSLPLDRSDLVAHRLFAFQRIVVASPEYLRQRGEPKTAGGARKARRPRLQRGSGRRRFVTAE